MKNSSVSKDSDLKTWVTLCSYSRCETLTQSPMGLKRAKSRLVITGSGLDNSEDLLSWAALTRFGARWFGGIALLSIDNIGRAGSLLVERCRGIIHSAYSNRLQTS